MSDEVASLKGIKCNRCQSIWITDDQFEGAGPSNDDDYCAYCSYEEACGEKERLEHLIQAFHDEIERTLAQRRQDNRGGQQVTDHGDFAGCTTSSLRRLRWWAREFQLATGLRPK